MQVTRHARITAALDRLAPDGPIGLAVSGGPDSLALLWLTHQVRAGAFEVATVDHGLRPEAAAEATIVARLCGELAVPHSILQVEVAGGASLQAQARTARYAALRAWALERGLTAVATAHHRDDVAETMLMRLARGSGVGGLAGMRETRALGEGVRLIRPLLDWRKAELVALVEQSGLDPVSDPANRDERHDRTRFRALLAEDSIFDSDRLARSAATLREAEDALAFTAEELAAARVRIEGRSAEVDAGGLPAEYQRRLLSKAMASLGANAIRGPDLDRALAAIRDERSCTLGGLRLSGGEIWRLEPEPPRRA
ncbi:hypothetical protein GCM10022281_12980 [Sphingomonas rosea]|uniref:tRNA(Ile)-lysidine synthase n=1 Tax=Sphingomonas rosea TaxID=335605 RepID=A0ABP7U1C4_9SPHN